MFNQVKQGLKRLVFPTNFKMEEDQKAAHNLSLIILATAGAYLFISLITLYSNDWQTIQWTLSGTLFQVVAWWLLRRGHLRASSKLVVLSGLGTLTILATVGQGIRDVAVLGFPIIIIFASLTLERAFFRISIGLTLTAVAWLAFGEINRWFTPQPLPPDPANLIYFTTVTIIVLVAALAVDLLATHMRKNLRQAQDEIVRRKQAEIILRESEERYKMTFEQAPLAINITRGTDLIYTNPAYLSMFGYSSLDEIRRVLPLELFTSECRPMIMKNIQLRAQGGSAPSSYEAGCLRKDGSRFPVILNFSRVTFSDGPATVGFIIDITESKRVEEKLRATLEEKETLLREVHHRVKNNLQVIIALIKMRSTSIQAGDTQQFLKELEGQARTMSLVYEQLYQAENLSQIAMNPYLRQLTSNILDTFGYRAAISIHIDTPLVLNVAQAMPCGLIVNELFTNILKHAFPPEYKAECVVIITMQQEGATYHLTISDNGVGLPGEFDWRSAKTLGLHLVNLWATHQLGGTMDVTSKGGTTFAIAFELED